MDNKYLKIVIEALDAELAAADSIGAILRHDPTLGEEACKFLSAAFKMANCARTLAWRETGTYLHPLEYGVPCPDNKIKGSVAENAAARLEKALDAIAELEKSAYAVFNHESISIFKSNEGFETWRHYGSVLKRCVAVSH